MGKGVALLQGLGLGAGFMYLFDPDRGRRRRALLRDKAVHAFHVTKDTLNTGARDLIHRATGVPAEARARLMEGTVSDETLEARVRAKLGHCVSHPHAIHVAADQGWVTLSGLVLAEEVCGLLEDVASVHGVIYIVNRLEVHAHAAQAPALQGEAPGTERSATEWSPATRLLVGVAGGALLLYGSRHRNARGAACRRSSG